MPANLSQFRAPLVIILVSLFSLSAFSQQKNNYSLLWKITGNGLSKPSYLFGTMHVKDKRVFNFSDSVMRCIQSCKQFALEVHPDTITHMMFSLLQSKDTSRNIDKLLSKEQYEQLAKRFKAKNGYEMGKADPMLLESLMNNEDKADDQVSFIDAYLYGIARTLNKDIRGLEDANMQFDEYFKSRDAIKERLLDLIDDNTVMVKDEVTEEMIKIYSTGDLNAIFQYIQQHSIVDSEFVERNKVMANSIIKYMTAEPLFTAIGVAHLPGTEGVIALLRKAGYTVTQVKADFTGVANTFHIDYMKMNWPEYRDENKGYTVNFPGTPSKFPLDGADVIMYVDMANNAYYATYAVPRGTVTQPANRVEVINRIIKNLKANPKNKFISQEDFLYNKIPCTELLIKTTSGYSRMRLLLVNNMLYGFYAGAKLQYLKEPYINRFLNSFVSIPVPQKPITPWVNYTNTEGAFTIKFPGQPKEIIKETPFKANTKQYAFKLNMYVSTDSVNSKSYLFRYNDYPPKTYLKDKTSLFNSLVSDFEKLGKLTSAPVKIYQNGYEGREAKVVLNGGFNTSVRLFIRGNRVYLLLKEITQPDLKDDGTYDPFFDSFKMTPYAEPVYYTYKPDNENFLVKMLSKPDVLIDSSKSYSSYLNHIVTCYSTNPNSGGLFGFEYSKISSYYRIENTDSLYKKLVDHYTGYQDSILKTDTIDVNGIKAREIITINKET
ncbi:MAG: hypothetical protein JWP44_3490, partial [Mucilaginibacter sp.]|nr:hypothetical protein [Mucilaginibacter sp.]